MLATLLKQMSRSLENLKRQNFNSSDTKLELQLTERAGGVLFKMKQTQDWEKQKDWKPRLKDR